MAEETIEPTGEARADLRMAILASLIANIFRDDKKHPQPFKPADFMPRFGPEVEEEESEPDWVGQLELVKMLNEAFGGQPLEGKEGSQ